MVFSSLSFLIIFLPLLIIIYFSIPKKWKNIRQYVLLLFSLLFYASGEPLYIFLIVGCILSTWILSKAVNKKNKTALIVSILINVIPLLITKYSGFIVQNINHLFNKDLISIPSIVMPIGISFYTFQVITYIVDLYRGKIKRQKNPFLFALYIMFFPQLIAGPIVKYEEVEKQIEKPDVSWDNIKIGTEKFIIGLGKKVLIANQVGYIASTIGSNPINGITTGMAWLCVLAYTIQIYFDFSGYSEMAIGLGKLFGFHFPDNFQNPYTVTSVAEFWRKWHITLGRFFREYVYIPLGGNRVKRLRWIINIFIVWALTGLWHGASWNFVLWGVYYGVLLVIEKTTGIDKKMPKALSWFVTMIIVMFGWAIFMNDGIGLKATFKFIAKLLFINGNIVNPVTIGSLKLWGYIPFLIIGLFISVPIGVNIIKKISEFRSKDNKIINVLSDFTLIMILVLSLMFLIGGTYNPFIYFRF